MNILFITRTDPEDRRAYSGTFYSIYKALKVHHQIEWIGESEFTLWQKAFFFILRKTARIMGYTYLPENTKLFSKFYAFNVKKDLKNKKFDIIFSPISSDLIAYLETDKPIVYLSDATFESLVDYYKLFTNLSPGKIKGGNEIEKRVQARADKIIYSSEWARSSSINYYKTPAEKVSTIPFGPNLARIPERLELSLKALPGQKLKILFLGVDWERKGGEIAYGAYLLLKNKGIDCSFTIIGCVPPFAIDDVNVTIISFLDKNKPDEFGKLYSILLNTDLFLLPTRAECCPIVVGEASAFGIPSVSTDTGGVGTAVKDGVNGFLLPIEAKSDQYADKIEEIWGDKRYYSDLREKSRKEYETRLSWEIWSKEVNKLLSELKR
ncbi:MAG: glycosyltransferase family 4 protein [Bacteroidota bacterium]